MKLFIEKPHRYQGRIIVGKHRNGLRTLQEIADKIGVKRAFLASAVRYHKDTPKPAIERGVAGRTVYYVEADWIEWWNSKSNLKIKQ